MAVWEINDADIFAQLEENNQAEDGLSGEEKKPLLSAAKAIYCADT